MFQVYQALLAEFYDTDADWVDATAGYGVLIQGSPPAWTVIIYANRFNPYKYACVYVYKF